MIVKTDSAGPLIKKKIGKRSTEGSSHLSSPPSSRTVQFTQLADFLGFYTR